MPPYKTINLHPTSHLVSSLDTDTFDVICIGSGWAGRVLASRVAASGLKSLVIETELIGGDCPFWACVPSKALLRPAESLEDSRQVQGVKETVSADRVDVGAVFARRDKITTNWDDRVALVPSIKKSGAHVIRGKGRIAGEREVIVEDLNGAARTLHARRAVAVCTGSEPIIPPIPGLSDACPWTPRQATSSSTVPKHLLIIGAGAVGCEMATAYQSFGSEVTIVTSGPRLLHRFDPEVGELLRKSLEDKGVTIHASAAIIRISRDSASGRIIAVLGTGDILHADEVLVAAGRRAKTAGIGLDTYNLPTDGSPIPVNESLCVETVPGQWLYAAGDVNGRHPLTHGSKYHGRIMANSILGASEKAAPEPWSPIAATADTLAQPQVIFTRPTVASVGLTRTDAEKAGISYRAITSPSLTTASRIRRDDAADGWAQWIVEKSTNRLLGATLVGDEVGELIHAYTVAIVGQMTLDRLAHAVPAFPTLSEVHLNLLEAAGL